MSKMTTVTSCQNSIQICSHRKSLSDIQKIAKDRKKFYDETVVYDAKNENDFFGIVETQIYDNIRGEDT